MRYLLDTNIVSDLVRYPRGKIASRISDVGEGDVCTSIIVAAELRFGAAKKNSCILRHSLKLCSALWKSSPSKRRARCAKASDGISLLRWRSGGV